MSQDVQSSSDAKEVLERGHGLTGCVEIIRRVLKTVEQHKWIIVLLLAYAGASWLMINTLHLIKVESISLHLLFDRALLLMSLILILSFWLGIAST